MMNLRGVKDVPTLSEHTLDIWYCDKPHMQLGTARPIPLCASESEIRRATIDGVVH